MSVEYRLTAAGRELQQLIDIFGSWGARWALDFDLARSDSPHNYTAPLHEAQSSREQRLLVEQSGKRQHQRL